jgi:hypothetical protein
MATDLDLTRIERHTRDISKSLEKIVKLAERGNSSQLEGLVEPGPPTCPHCGMFNPVITELADRDNSGPLGQFIFIAECHNCNKKFYGLVQGWILFQTQAELMDAIQRAENNGL